MVIPRGGRYQVLRQIGAGAMGVVYEALDTETRARVAIKTLHVLDGQRLYRFKREFRALQHLEHPNLVDLRELVEQGGRWFIAMELVEGVDFLRYVRPAADPADEPSEDFSPSQDTLQGERLGVRDEVARPVVDQARLRDALGQLALGLSALHAAGMVHRDIKPSNVLVTAQGRVVVLDFGLISDATDEEARRSTDAHVVGTAVYMAPEQAASRPVGPAADWYSVGVMLYEALTGRPPFFGGTLQILMDKQGQAPLPPSAVAPEIAADLDALCVELLQFTPEARPAGPELLRRLGVDGIGASAVAPASSDPTEAPPFVGRDAELAVLRHAFADVQQGNTVAVYVHGESGLGKSTLLRHFTDCVVGGEAVVLAGRCRERESVPYKALDGVVDVLSHYLRRLSEHDTGALVPRHAALLPTVFPVLGRVEAIAQAARPRQEVQDPHELRNRAFAALRELLLRLAETRLVVLVIDDLQWADADSLLLLHHLLRPPGAPPLLLLVSSREPPVAGGDGAAVLPGDIRVVPLASLEIADASRLARRLLGQTIVASTVSPAAIAVEARGHPLYIAELARHAVLAGAGDGQRGEFRLDDAIWRRVAELAPEVRVVLELVSLVGAPLPQEVIRQAARQDAADFARHASLLRVAHLVRSRGSRGQDAIEPYHDRVREAVQAHVEAPTRIALHGRLAAAIDSAGLGKDRPELLLRQLEAAGEASRAAAHAEAAARRAVDAFAFDQAAELYRAALRLGEYAAEPARALQRRLGESLASAGRGAEAASVFLAAAEGADPATRLHCEQQAAEQLLLSGHIEQGVEAVSRLLAGMGVAMPPTPRAALISLLWHRARVRVRGLGWHERHERQISEERLRRLDVYQAVAHGLSMVDPIRGADFQARGLLLALRAGEPMRVGRALFFEAIFISVEGITRIGRARQVYERARIIAERTGHPTLRAWQATADGFITYCEGRFRRAADKFRDACAIFSDETSGTAWEQASIRNVRIWSLLHAGAVAELRTIHGGLVEDAARRGDRYAETTLRKNSFLVWLASDDPAGARQDLERAIWAPPEGRYHLQHWFDLEARSYIALYTGEAAALHEQVEGEWQALARSLLTRTQIVRTFARALRARLAIAAAPGASGPRLDRDVARVAHQLEREHIGYAQVWAALLRAGIAARRGDQDRAVAALRFVVPAAEQNEMLLYAAAGRRRLGELLGGDEGHALIEAADAAMRDQTIVDPARMTEVFAPGFDRR
ncbi:MAG TPA: protein kinase [Kofleriaceae bacterium]|nr:protein kinase [Kofleriaceae bacterium]